MNYVIESKLKFLVDEYGFEFSSTWKTPEAKYIFENKYGRFIYLELPQFQENYFLIEDEKGKRKINIYLNYETLYEQWQKQHSGFKWFFKNKDKNRKLWEFHAKIIKENIDSTGALFGLRIK